MIKEKITNNKKKIFVTVLAIFLLGGGYFSFFAKNDGEELKYETEKVVKGVIQSAIAVDGKIIFDTWNLEFLNSGTLYLQGRNIARELRILWSHDRFWA